LRFRFFFIFTLSYYFSFGTPAQFEQTDASEGIYQFGYQCAEKKKDKLIFLTNNRFEVIIYGFGVMNAIEPDLIRTKNEHQCI